MKNKRTNPHLSRSGRVSSRKLWHPEVPGPLWNGTRRVASRQIRAYCRVLARELHPQKIILFGSYASDSAKRESDVDLVVVMPVEGSSTSQAVKIRGRMQAAFPMDLLVWKLSQIQR